MRIVGVLVAIPFAGKMRALVGSLYAQEGFGCGTVICVVDMPFGWVLGSTFPALLIVSIVELVVVGMS